MRSKTVYIDGRKLKKDCDAWCKKHGISFSMLSKSSGQSKSWLRTACSRNVISDFPFRELITDTGLKAEDYITEDEPVKKAEPKVENSGTIESDIFLAISNQTYELKQIKELLRGLLDELRGPAEKGEEHGTV